MKKNLHPKTNQTRVHCTCGNDFTTTSTSKEIKVTLCSQCHPYFTGEQKHVDTAGRIEKFNLKYNINKL